MPKRLSKKGLLKLIQTDPALAEFLLSQNKSKITLKKLSKKGLLKLKETNPLLGDFLLRHQTLNTPDIDLTELRGEDGQTPTEEEVLALIKPLIPKPVVGQDGLDGDSPTKHELLDLIIPLIPEPIPGEDGVTPSKDELLALIEPLIPPIPTVVNGKDGRTPTEDELRVLIHPLIQKMMPIFPKLDEKKMLKDIVAKINLPEEKKAKDIARELESLRGPDRLDYKALKNRPGIDLSKGAGAGGGGKLVVKDEGTTLNENVTSIDFVGADVTATNSGRAVTVTVSAAGTGDVVGPGSSTDNAIARFDGVTGKLIQNSGITISDADVLAGASIDFAANTITGTMAQFDTALTDGDFAFAGGAFHDGFSDYVANEHIDHTSVTLTAGIGLTGGGDISASRTFDLDIPGLTDLAEAIASDDSFAIYNTSGTAHAEATITQLETYMQNNLTFPADQNLWETISSDSGSTTADTTTDTLTVSGGTSISTAIVGDTLTITNDAPNVDQNLWLTMSSDSGSVAANTTTDTFTIAGGTGISTAISGDTVTITNDSPNVDQNLFETFTVTDTDAGFTWAATGSIVADTTTDTLTLVSGVGIDIDADTTNDAVRATLDLNDLPTETSIAAGDFIAMVDITDSGSGKITFANLEGAIDHTNLLNIGTNTHAQIDSHIASTSNPHSTSDANLVVSDITTNNTTTSAHGFAPKLSGTSTQFLDGNGNWTTPAGTANAYFSQAFSGATSINVVHNFGAYPIVQVLLSTSVTVPLTITHNTVNDFTVTFTSAETGTVLATLGSPQLNNYTVAPGNYTGTSDDYIINATGTGSTITLPTAVGFEAKIFIIKNTATGNITVDTTSSQLIDTQLTLTLKPLESVSVFSDGANYNIF